MIPEIVFALRLVFVVGLVLLFVLHRPLLRWYRAKRYERGRKLDKKQQTEAKPVPKGGGLRWGNTWLPENAATQHFVSVGTTGSGKSQVQRLLMKEPLLEIGERYDSRALIFDAKGDTTAYLKRIGVTAPVFSLNPFDARDKFPRAVVWDIAKDITSPARALNLACSLIKQERGSNNQYFSDAARLVVTGIIESFIRHSGTEWTFADLVQASLSQKRMEQVLSRDEAGRDVLDGLLGDDRTGYAVASTVLSKMRYFSSVAALWQRAHRKISMREWLGESSILLLGSNATAKASIDALNEQVFKVMVEEIDVQTNSSKRRTWVWLDEARLSGSLLQSDLLPFLAVKGRSKGVAILLAFQDIDGFREAAGPRVAAEIIAQCTNKALLRMESDESASWASKVLGQFETIEVFRSDNASGTSLVSMSHNVSEQRVVKDSVLASEFYDIPVTNPVNGLTGYFVTASSGAYRGTVPSSDVGEVVVSDWGEKVDQIVYRPEADQWLRDWTPKDRERLVLEQVTEQEITNKPERGPKKKLKLKRGRERNGIEDLRMPST